MKDLTPFREKGPNVSSGIHRSGEDIRMVLRWLRLVDQSPQNPCQCDSFLHRATRGRRRQRLEMKGQVMFYRSRGLNGFNFECGADIGQGARSERQRLGMMLLPALIFGT